MRLMKVYGDLIKIGSEDGEKWIFPQLTNVVQILDFMKIYLFLCAHGQWNWLLRKVVSVVGSTEEEKFKVHMEKLSIGEMRYDRDGRWDCIWFGRIPVGLHDAEDCRVDLFKFLDMIKYEDGLMSNWNIAQYYTVLGRFCRYRDWCMLRYNIWSRFFN